MEEGRLELFQIRNRELLRSVMKKAGFEGIINEWWHYNGLPENVIKEKYAIIE